MKRTKTVTNETTSKPRPGLTPEARENQIIAAAMNLVEERILNGSASSQEVTHFLKLGSTKEKMEREKLRLETELVKAKTESIKAQQHADELFVDAMKAFAKYSGNNIYNDEQEENDDESYY